MTVKTVIGRVQSLSGKQWAIDAVDDSRHPVTVDKLPFILQFF